MSKKYKQKSKQENMKAVGIIILMVLVLFSLRLFLGEYDNAAVEQEAEVTLQEVVYPTQEVENTPETELMIPDDYEDEAVAESVDESANEAVVEAVNEVIVESVNEAVVETVNGTPAEVVTKLDVRFRNKKLLNEHYNKHGIEMGFASAEEYEAAAAAVVNNPEALHKTEAEDGDDVFYVESTNEFVIVSTDGYIRTYFNPSSGIAYYNRQ